MNISNEKLIRKIVKTSIESFAEGFSSRHMGEIDNPDGIINMKIHNIFIAILGKEIQYYTALVRSLDSSLGNVLEKMAINIAELFYDVSNKVEGNLYKEQTSFIAELLEKYKRHEIREPKVTDYKDKIFKLRGSVDKVARHDSDYYLFDKKSKSHYLIELKIGGDLDNKKARSEKEALLEQYAILTNHLDSNENVSIHFATAYNRFGENVEWKQTRVMQYFSKDELLIGRDFWNFICKSNNGYEIIIDEYRKNSAIIIKSLEKIKKSYLK